MHYCLAFVILPREVMEKLWNFTDASCGNTDSVIIQLTVILTKTSEKLQAETACELHFAIDIFGPPFTIKRGPYATLLSVCLSSSSIGWDR